MNKFIFIIILILTGCSVHRSEIKLLEKPIEEHKSYPAVKATSVPTIVKSYNLLYKSYISPEEKLPSELITFIYFPKKPITEKEKSLYNKVCNTWSNGILSYQEASTHYDKTNEQLVPFYWFIKNNNRSPNCEFMIENYDYARAQQLMRQTKLDVKKAQFVAIYKEYRVTMNISSLTDEEDIVKAVQGWSTYMTKVPDKDDIVYVFNMVDSLMKVLGSLDYLVTTKFKS